MKFLNVLPIVIMVEAFVAAIPLAIIGRYGSALYWIAAGLLNLAVIFIIPKVG